MRIAPHLVPIDIYRRFERDGESKPCYLNRLAEWLNTSNDHEAVSRIEQLLGELTITDLQHVSATLRRELEGAKRDQVQQFSPKCFNLLERSGSLNDLLSRYYAIKMHLVPPRFGSKWRLMLHVSPASPAGQLGGSPRPAEVSFPAYVAADALIRSEEDAVEAFVMIAVDGLADSIRRCEHCRRWFVPSTRRSKCCKKKCYQALRDQREERKQMHKRVNRAARQREKDADAKYYNESGRVKTSPSKLLRGR